MVELMEKIDTLKDALNQIPSIRNLEKIQLEILNDTKLYKQVVEKSSSLSEEPKIIEYRKLENEVNFLILEINDYLKKEFRESRDFHESH